MARAIFIIIFVFTMLVFGIYFFTKSPKDDLQSYQLKTTTMKISSPTFQNNSAIPEKYTCDGENTNPPLEISEVPVKAQSLVLIVDDPDAPGGIWVHWTVWNIDPKTTKIGENSVPIKAVEGATSFGGTGYGGPCPPSGAHRYFFKLYALDATLDLSPQSDKTALGKAMEGHILDKAELIGLYSRLK
jgi:hypothetical protein